MKWFWHMKTENGGFSPIECLIYITMVKVNGTINSDGSNFIYLMFYPRQINKPRPKWMYKETYIM